MIESFTSIYFVDSLNGWATSRYIWQTTNSGQNWIRRTDISITFSTDIYFSEIDTGWIARYSSINPSFFKTTNGGLDWSVVPQVLTAWKFFFFPDPIHFLINGLSHRYITIDGGATWLEITSDVISGFNSFQAPTNNLGYAVGGAGLILRYADTTYVPVDLIFFEGKIESNKIILNWKTASELNNSGFYIEKSFDKINWFIIGFVKGNGTSTNLNFYFFTDSEIRPHQFYRLKQIDYDGSFEYSNTIVVSSEISFISFALSQNYPNPFNSKTKIQYDIPTDTKVQLKIYDILGREVKTLVNDYQNAGRYNFEFNATNLTSGVYIYQIRANNFIASRKLIFIK